jgi:hypothetical protein
VAEHRRDAPAGELGRETVCVRLAFRGDEAAVGDRRAEELGRRQRLPVGEPALG